MTGRLQDKIALVTGAGCVGPGWGNGRATAVLFARQGAKVFAVDKSGEAMKETLERVREFGGEIKSHECDVTDNAAWAAMVAACLAAYGRIDILVNNVGGSADRGSRAFRSASWATAATPPTPRCFWPPTRRASSPEPRSWWTAEWSRAAIESGVTILVWEAIVKFQKAVRSFGLVLTILAFASGT